MLQIVENHTLEPTMIVIRKLNRMIKTITINIIKDILILLAKAFFTYSPVF